MHSKNKKILQKIFERPTRSDIEWKSIESFLRSLGAEITDRKWGKNKNLFKWGQSSISSPSSSKRSR